MLPGKHSSRGERFTLASAADNAMVTASTEPHIANAIHNIGIIVMDYNFKKTLPETFRHKQNRVAGSVGRA